MEGETGALTPSRCHTLPVTPPPLLHTHTHCSCLQMFLVLGESRFLQILLLRWNPFHLSQRKHSTVVVLKTSWRIHTETSPALEQHTGLHCLCSWRDNDSEVNGRNAASTLSNVAEMYTQIYAMMSRCMVHMHTASVSISFNEHKHSIVIE